MTNQQIADAIRTKAKALLESLNDPSVDKIAWDNHKVDVEDDNLWVRVSMLPHEADQVSLGKSRRFRTSGVVVFSIYTRIGLGTKLHDIVADQIVTAFRATSVGGVVYRTPKRQQVGRMKDEPWWQVNVIVPFFADDTET